MTSSRSHELDTRSPMMRGPVCRSERVCRLGRTLCLVQQADPKLECGQPDARSSRCSGAHARQSRGSGRWDGPNENTSMDERNQTDTAVSPMFESFRILRPCIELQGSKQAVRNSSEKGSGSETAWSDHSAGCRKIHWVRFVQ